MPLQPNEWVLPLRMFAGGVVRSNAKDLHDPSHLRPNSICQHRSELLVALVPEHLSLAQTFKHSHTVSSHLWLKAPAIIENVSTLVIGSHRQARAPL